MQTNHAYSIPADFEFYPGCCFMLDASTPAIYIGPGGCRVTETVPLMAGDDKLGSVERLKFEPIDGHAIAWWYKAEWHMTTLAKASDKAEAWPRDGWTFSWTDAAEKAVMSRSRWIDGE